MRRYSFSKSVKATANQDSQFLTTLPSYLMGIFMFAAINPSNVGNKMSYNAIVTPSEGIDIVGYSLICSQNLSVGTQSEYIRTNFPISNIYYAVINGYQSAADITFTINGIYFA